MNAGERFKMVVENENQIQAKTQLFGTLNEAKRAAKAWLTPCRSVLGFKVFVIDRARALIIFRAQ